jgi:hypothetical protein
MEADADRRYLKAFAKAWYRTLHPAEGSVADHALDDWILHANSGQ